MSRVLVTGAGGFVGRQAVEALSARGHEVHGASRRPPTSGSIHWHAADLLEDGAASSLIETVRPDRLLHLAWVTDPGSYWTSPENERWVAASVRLLEEFAAAGGERAVVSGSCAEYDWSAEGDLSERSTPLSGDTPYAQAKLKLSEAAEALAERSGLSLGWGRLFFLYGPGEHPDRLVSSVARRLLAGEAAPVSEGSQVRDFLYVADAGDALATLLEGDLEGPVNIASGAGTTVAELIDRVANAAGAPELIKRGALPLREGDPPRLVADVARLRDELGWEAVTPVDEGARRSVDWWRDRAPAQEPSRRRQNPSGQ